MDAERDAGPWEAHMALIEAVLAVGDFEDILRAERPRLVRMCRRLTGSDAAAEDVAQETLLEAWRHADMLTDATGASRWLAAIARNVALRWARRQGRDAARLVPLGAPDATAPGAGARPARPGPRAAPERGAARGARPAAP